MYSEKGLLGKMGRNVTLIGTRVYFMSECPIREEAVRSLIEQAELTWGPLIKLRPPLTGLIVKWASEGQFDNVSRK